MFPALNVSPSNITLGLTETMRLECSIKVVNKSLIAIVVSHSRDTVQPTFTYISSVSSFQGVNNYISDTSMYVTGAINSTGLSYLNITWSYPQEESAGLYKCEVNEIDEIGKPLRVSSTATVSVALPSIGSVISEINHLRKELNELKFEFSSLKNVVSLEISSLKNLFNNVDNKTETLQQKNENESAHWTAVDNQNKIRFASIENKTNSVVHMQENFVRTIASSRDELFISSNNFKGKKYLLTKEAAFFYPSLAQAVCTLFGGYLAEMDTSEEFNFVRTFVRSHGSQFMQVMAGGSDEGHEGHWTYRHSKSAVVSFWGPGEPDNYNGENCQNFYRNLDYRMADGQCIALSSTSVGFLCEVPA
ncbi:uncharacterized protein LOC106051637 isoform X2 [Biomphalaria glabrata]|nr:uncharacterized protein LOC106051637 isoform X2 [Biomphalaria glabrata]XP_055866252.1 uncharacterized protein LOC106051637 isoform X2 [Biomphalaria glabrata]